MYLDTEITIQGDVVGLDGEEVSGGDTTTTASSSSAASSSTTSFELKHHHLALLVIEIGGERGQIEFGEERSLEHRVDAMHGAQLRLLYLVVQHPSIARSLHSLSKIEEIEKTKP